MELARYVLGVSAGRMDTHGKHLDMGGVSMANALEIIFSVITSNMKNAASSATDIVAEGRKAATEVVESGTKQIGKQVDQAGEKVTEKASSVVKGVGQLFGGDKGKSNSD